MALSDIQTTVLKITGATPTANSIEDAQRFIVASVPKELLWFAGAKSSAIVNDSGYNIQSSDTVLSVEREGYPSDEVPFSKAKWIDDSASLHKATKLFPKHYFAQGKVFIKPAPASGGDDDGYVYYVDWQQIDDDCDLRNAVIYYTCSSEFTQLGSGKIIDWADLAVPVVPTISAAGVTITGIAPTYISPVISLTAFPTITWSFPSGPIAPITSAQSVSAFGNVPTFTPPVMSSPDFSDTENWITTEEDSEMLAARVQEIQAKIGEFSARLGESQAKFNKDNSIFQADVQEKIQEAQLSDAEENRKLQIYQGELSSYQAEVNKVVTGNQAQIAEWQIRSTTDIQKFGADIQNALNSFNEEAGEYQALLQKDLQDAQLVDANEAKKIQKYAAEVQKYQSQVGERTAKIGSAIQNAAYYSKESDKYYQWAKAEVQMYIQNNSKMISMTMAAQTSAQQRR